MTAYYHQGWLYSEVEWCSHGNGYKEKGHGWSFFKGSGGGCQERHEAAREGWRLAPPNPDRKSGFGRY